MLSFSNSPCATLFVSNVVAAAILLLGATPAKAFDPFSVGIVTYLVGKGLINEAKEAVMFASEEARNRIDQAGDRADKSIQLASEEMKKI